MVRLENIFVRDDNVVVREVVGEILLVPISGDLADMERVFSFNSLGLFVWNKLDGKTSLDVILGEILSDYEVGREEAEADLKELIGDLLDAGLIIYKDHVVEDTAG